MQTQLNIQRALISVSDKTGLVEFATHLVKYQVEILATGGTAKLLKEANIPLIEISDYTGFPEIMGGRVKTLHPKIAGGILARRGTDEAVMQAHDIQPIDLVVVNLYPFAETIKRKDTTLSDAVEQIDIGGPTLLRAAAKNFSAVTTLVDPGDYETVLDEMDRPEKNTTLKTRQRLAQKVFSHTAKYDTLIANYLNEQQNGNSAFPETYLGNYTLAEVLRYGENPHQRAALYCKDTETQGTLTGATLLQGKPLSYNNMIDADCAFRIAQSFTEKNATCVIVKHATPCGVAAADTLTEAYKKAHACDPQSAFGGIIACNQPVDQTLANTILNQQFLEVIIAPEFTSDALETFKNKPNVRVLATGQPSSLNNPVFALHTISGGLLVQDEDAKCITADDLEIVTKRKPTQAELADLLFAWHVVKFVKSNAIVYAKNQVTLGIGTGQTSRVFAAEIAALRASAAKLNLHAAAMASDAFFPFADSIETAAKLGITAIIQPGGSKRDPEVIQCADAHNIAMAFTQIRHFRH